MINCKFHFKDLVFESTVKLVREAIERISVGHAIFGLIK